MHAAVTCYVARVTDRRRNAADRERPHQLRQVLRPSRCRAAQAAAATLPRGRHPLARVRLPRLLCGQGAGAVRCGARPVRPSLARLGRSCAATLRRSHVGLRAVPFWRVLGVCAFLRWDTERFVVLGCRPGAASAAAAVAGGPAAPAAACTQAGCARLARAVAHFPAGRCGAAAARPAPFFGRLSEAARLAHCSCSATCLARNTCYGHPLLPEPLRRALATTQTQH